jgi:hypothetical protein
LGNGGGRTVTERSRQTAAAYESLLDAAREVAARIASDDRLSDDPVSELEVYKWATSIVQVALDAYVWADSARPRFVDIVGPYKKWGGDNADAFYQYAPIDPMRTYRVKGRRGDAAYLSLTVYGGPDDGRYSERIVGALSDRLVEVAADGTFEMVLSPEPRQGAWLELTPDAVCAITRDYLADPARGRRAEWSIEALDPPATRRESDDDLARRFGAAETWVREQASLLPVGLGEPNLVEEPYPVSSVTFGWAAGDAAYASGSFDLADDEVLLIEGRSPECAFWNVCLWNQLLHTYNYDYERVTLNGSQVDYEADGSWTVAVAATDPGHPNWISTAGHPRGRIWFRWFLPTETPARPATRVVPLNEAHRLRRHR